MFLAKHMNFHNSRNKVDDLNGGGKVEIQAQKGGEKRFLEPSTVTNSSFA